MQQIFDSLLEYLAGSWPELIWIIIVAGCASYYAGRKSRTRWKQRDFLDRLNVSLTSIDQGVLKIRTLFEMDVEAVFLNGVASSQIVSMAKKTTAADPFIPIAKEDVWYYLNPVLNEISERFALGYLQADAGRSVTSEQYLLCLTCERAGAVRTQKIRGMVVRKSLLQALPEEEPAYESPSHATRWGTLQQMRQRWSDRPEDFLVVELCF
ncbi:hypothetical protein OAF83_03465 [Rubripirellula sp.]|nr:hypothetical protein [Rubripirellula sp.]MDB4749943.1 hypothetical protein [Rubripirellula sp.]